MPPKTHPIVYWHLDLPPISADICGEDVIEAKSPRVAGSLSHRDEAWEKCYADLMEHARVLLEQEVARRDGDYAHVKDEVIDTRHDDATGETWLYGRFGYVLYREPNRATHPPREATTQTAPPQAPSTPLPSRAPGDHTG